MSNIIGIVKSARKIMYQDIGTGSDELRILQLGWMLFPLAPAWERIQDLNKWPDLAIK